jgi:hypothetical protein
VIAGRFVEPGGDSIDLQEADPGWLLRDARISSSGESDAVLVKALREAVAG